VNITGQKINKCLQNSKFITHITSWARVFLEKLAVNQMVRNCSSSDTTSHSRWPESAITKFAWKDWGRLC